MLSTISWCGCFSAVLIQTQDSGEPRLEKDNRKQMDIKGELTKVKCCGFLHQGVNGF